MKLIDVENITDEDILFYLGPKYESCIEDIRNMLNEQSVAFDIGNVIEEIKEESFEVENDLIPGMSFDAVFADVAVDIINDRGIKKSIENK